MHRIIPACPSKCYCIHVAAHMIRVSYGGGGGGAQWNPTPWDSTHLPRQVTTIDSLLEVSEATLEDLDLIPNPHPRMNICSQI